MTGQLLYPYEGLKKDPLPNANKTGVLNVESQFFKHLIPNDDYACMIENRNEMPTRARG